MLKTIDFFETKGKESSKPMIRNGYGMPIPGLREEGEDLRHPPHPGDLTVWRTRTTAGHLAQLRVQRDPGLLRPPLLVHLAGLHPGPRADLDEQQ